MKRRHVVRFKTPSVGYIYSVVSGFKQAYSWAQIIYMVSGYRLAVKLSKSHKLATEHSLVFKT